MANRYEDTTPYEREVMTSMGYQWREHSWQKSYGNTNFMSVHAWVGQIPKQSGRISMWDSKLGDMNNNDSVVRDLWEDDSPPPMVPPKVPEEVKKKRREEFKRLFSQIDEVKKKLVSSRDALTQEINKNLDKIKKENDPLTKSELNLLSEKLQLQKEKEVGIQKELELEEAKAKWRSEGDEAEYYFDETGKGKYGTLQDAIDNETAYYKSLDVLKNVVTKQNNKIKNAENNVSKAEKEFNDVKDSVKFVADFYKEVFKVYGEKAEQLAKALANQAKGKKTRNANDALKSYEKHKANINKKINAKDRKAIATALESVKVADIANNFKRFSKGMGYAGIAIDVNDLRIELIKAYQTDNWRPFFVKAETIMAGMAATAVVGFAFSFLLGGPIGLLGYGLIMAVVGALIDDKLVEDANKLIGI